MNLEHAVTITNLPIRARLGRADFLHFKRQHPLRLRADRGSLWVTLDGHPEDIEIEPGKSREFDGQSALTVGALGGEAIVSAAPVATRESWVRRLLHSPLAGQALPVASPGPRCG